MMGVLLECIAIILCGFVVGRYSDLPFWGFMSAVAVGGFIGEIAAIMTINRGGQD